MKSGQGFERARIRVQFFAGLCAASAFASASARPERCPGIGATVSCTSNRIGSMIFRRNRSKDDGNPNRLRCAESIP
jgi:hypothetical protein